MSMNSSGHAPSHQAVDRALQVITFLGTRAGGASLQEISRATGIPKPSLHRTLSSMRDRGFASQLNAGGPYLLGPAALEAAFQFHANLDLRQLLRPLMLEIQGQSGQTVHLARLNGGDVVYLDKLESSIGVRLTSVIGGRNPAYCTGVGKALLADQLIDATAVAAWVDRYGPLTAHTATTITTEKALAADLEKTRKRGYAIDNEENEDSLFCVAATVPLVFGGLVPPLALSVTGLKDRMRALGVDRLGTNLVGLIADFEFTSTSTQRHNPGHNNPGHNNPGHNNPGHNNTEHNSTEHNNTTE
ncbi:IclR family transcriptional regulator [Rathayibacter soli]|uniref:IclR family transcriptional regulator n=1 Tax=Rathayibacter soli TaxID=3144168 RepID=UPI0027E47AC8|nr:IclR family transcriptional regulator C-terminal domain-containing protein [Glaciibacter superstes]